MSAVWAVWCRTVLVNKYGEAATHDSQVALCNGKDVALAHVATLIAGEANQGQCTPRIEQNAYYVREACELVGFDSKERPCV